jgi:hypothetical protein
MNLLVPVALWGFWILLGGGRMVGELGRKGVTIALLLWLAGFAGSRFAASGMLFTPYVAVLEIGLVIAVFKGDVILQ